MNCSAQAKNFKYLIYTGSTSQTLGESRVRVSFNVAGDSLVDQIKTKSAELIDLLQAVKNDELAKTYEQSPSVTQAQIGEKLRLIALAQTDYENAAMWAVKAVTG